MAWVRCRVQNLPSVSRGFRAFTETCKGRLYHTMVNTATFNYRSSEAKPTGLLNLDKVQSLAERAFDPKGHRQSVGCKASVVQHNDHISKPQEAAHLAEFDLTAAQRREICLPTACEAA